MEQEQQALTGTDVPCVVDRFGVTYTGSELQAMTLERREELKLQTIQRPNTPDELEAIRRAQPAVITQGEWEIIRWRISDTHRAITELERAIRPAMEQISSGKFSLASMLLGKRSS